ncbi:hypothetical protein CPB84DRAFT_1749436 [Gymnopilus junonius]|uniref:Uncharacterized protein n=1 Tax=Gymnopilus junonius TaxID=109634 RepID=A0A9P5NG14_GYMJU|nr:hypothetical protein CPB84DRAFT_1749436 [Gymnopilus junonius]
MLSITRAGLASLFLFFAFIGLVASAPLSERPLRFIARYDEYDLDLSTRSVNILYGREFDFEGSAIVKRDFDAMSILNDRDFGTEFNEYFERDYDHFTLDPRGFYDLEDEYIKRSNLEDLHLLHRRSIAAKIRHAFQHAFHKVGAAFKKAGTAIKKGFQKAGTAIKKGFQKVGKVMKKGFQKVGHFIKTTGAKIAKFGLKVVAAVATVVGKVVKFIPGIGQGLSRAAKGLAKGADLASNKIHAKLGKKLEKVSKGMDYVISPIGTAAKAAGKKLGAGGVVMDLFT